MISRQDQPLYDALAVLAGLIQMQWEHRFDTSDELKVANQLLARHLDIKESSTVLEFLEDRFESLHQYLGLPFGPSTNDHWEVAKGDF